MQRMNMLEQVLMQLPASISVLKGPNHVFQLINPPAREAIADREVLGKTVRDAFPEIEGQGFLELLDEVYSTGRTFQKKAMSATIMRNGEPVQLYVDVAYLPLLNTDGNIEGVISFSYDVTEMILSKMKLEETTEQLKQAYEDLEVKVKFRNLELEKINSELRKKIEELNSKVTE